MHRPPRRLGRRWREDPRVRSASSNLRPRSRRARRRRRRARRRVGSGARRPGGRPRRCRSSAPSAPPRRPSEGCPPRGRSRGAAPRGPGRSNGRPAPPHGVNQVSRPSTVSNASTGARVPSSPTSRSRWASCVPASTPCDVGARQARSSSLRATSVQVPSGSRRAIACPRPPPRRRRHGRPARRPPGLRSSRRDAARRRRARTAPLPCRSAGPSWGRSCHPPNAAAAARSISSRGTSRRCWAMPQRCPNGSVT